MSSQLGCATPSKERQDTRLPPFTDQDKGDAHQSKELLTVRIVLRRDLHEAPRELLHRLRVPFSQQGGT